MEYRAPKGTKDILPSETKRWDEFFAAVETVFSKYGYRRIETPIFEAEELFIRAIGEGTDIVNKEMYTFADKGGRLMTLRPEETAGVVRSFIEHRLYTETPLLKVYYKGPMFRYERPQGGRQRQFWQIGVEAIGNGGPALDAEVIDLAMSCLSAAGLEDGKLHLNSVGCELCRPPYTEALKVYLAENGALFCDTCVERAGKNPMRVFDCKNESCREALKGAPLIVEFLCEACSRHFDETKKFLDGMSIDYYEDAHLVRGLDYYTRTAFEIKSKSLGAQDAVAAGGRYDNLIKAYGGPDTPGIGFAVGVERVLLALGSSAADEPVDQDIYIVTLNNEARMAGLAIAKNVRAAGLSAALDFSGKPLKKQMANADRSGARYAVIIGEDELMAGSLTVRDLATGKQRGIDPKDLFDILTKKRP